MFRSRALLYRYVSNAGSSKCWNELNVLSVKRSPENTNSLYEQLRGIQATSKVSSGERCNARCTDTATGPPEVKMALVSFLPEADKNRERPRLTRAMKSSQDSTPSTINSARTHIVITVSKSFWKSLRRCGGLFAFRTAAWSSRMWGLLRESCGRLF